MYTFTRIAEIKIIECY